MLWALLGCSSPTTGRFEYILPDRELDVVDLDNHYALIKHIPLPQATLIRGVTAHAATHVLYITGLGATPDQDYLIKFDLSTDEIVWTKLLAGGVDSLCVTPDGQRLYIPGPNDQMWVVDAPSGNVVTMVTATLGPHNTICTADGKRVYVGAERSQTMTVISTVDNTVLRHLGPFSGNVRPFTIDAGEHYVFANVNGLLGFEVADAQTGAILYQVSPPGYTYTPAPGTPSHGIAMSPNGKEIWVVDQPFNRVHVFDITVLPSQAPVAIADIPLQGSLTGIESGGMGKEGWLTFSRDGHYLWVGDAGDIIDTWSRTVVAHLASLADTRKFLEIDFLDGQVYYAQSRAMPGGY